MEKAKRIKLRFEQLKSERRNFENLWQDVSEFVLPRKADFTVKQPAGRVRVEKIFDSTATNSAELLAGAVHGMLTNAAVPWFYLRFWDRKANGKDFEDFLSETSEVILQEINRPQCAFATNIQEVYLDLAVLGTAALYVGWNEKEQCLDFRSIFLNEIYIDEDDRGEVDTVFRRYSANVKRLVDQFGLDALPEEMKDEYNAERWDKKYSVIHAIYPNNEFVPSKPVVGGNQPFHSVYILEEKELVLLDGMFEEMPVMVVRWTKSSSETYGRSPAISVLPDIKMLQTMMKDTLESAAKANNPPYFSTDENSILPRSVLPGQFVYVEEIPQPMAIAHALPINDKMMEDTRARIREAFYNDALQLTGGARMTATEVMQRTEEKRRLMAPVLGRLEQELLGPMIMRVFSLLVEHGVIRIPEGQVLPMLKIEYVSPMAIAQKQEKANSILMAVQSAGAVSQTVKGVGSIVIKGDDAERQVMEAYGLEKLTRSKEEVEAIIQNQAQAVAEQNQIQQAAQGLELGRMANEVEHGAKENRGMTNA